MYMVKVLINTYICIDLCQGDEYHYSILKCCHYYKERKDLIKDSYTVSSNTLKMKHLLNSTDQYELINLAKCVSIITDHFKEALHHSSENHKT